MSIDYQNQLILGIFIGIFIKRELPLLLSGSVRGCQGWLGLVVKKLIYATLVLQNQEKKKKAQIPKECQFEIDILIRWEELTLAYQVWSV